MKIDIENITDINKQIRTIYTNMIIMTTELLGKDKITENVHLQILKSTTNIMCKIVETNYTSNTPNTPNKE